MSQFVNVNEKFFIARYKNNIWAQFVRYKRGGGLISFLPKIEKSSPSS